MEEIKEENLTPILTPVSALVPEPEKPLVPQDDSTDKLVPTEKLMAIYEKTMTNAENDRQEISGILEKFLDMVLNEGDATSASKEAVVNLVKAKSDINGQIIEMAKLMTNVKLKQRSIVDAAQNRAIHAQQNNIYLGKAADDETNILMQEIENASARIKKNKR